MKTRTMLSLGLSALVVAGTMVGGSTSGSIAAAASAENPKHAATEAAAARRALAKREGAKAVQHAELAVEYAPRVAEYRALLGQAYLLAGRFASAKQALADSLSLDPADAHVALNLTLAQIAQGDWPGARGTLDAHTDIAASDRGLAYALAGDPVKAVEILGPAAHEADATPKTRQNLALALALSGRWQEAKSVASIDLPADQLDARVMQWASFSRPANAYDQVASLLGVQAVQDAGQPAQLALAPLPANVGVAAAEPAPVPEVAAAPAAASIDTYMPTAPDAAQAAPVQTAAAEPQAVVEAQPESTQVAGTGPQVVFGPREEFVQHIPAARPQPVRAPAAIVRVATASHVPAASLAKGNFFVQLGAYGSPAVARDSWHRVAQQVPELGQQAPHSARVTTKAGNFYRLSVGGFARSDADALCRTVKSSGGVCFVRAQAGDAMASWARGGAQVASR